MKDAKLRVRCNWCEWEGNEQDLKIIPDSENYELEVCPVCGRADCLMDLNWFEVYVKGGNGND